MIETDSRCPDRIEMPLEDQVTLLESIGSLEGAEKTEALERLSLSTNTNILRAVASHPDLGESETAVHNLLELRHGINVFPETFWDVDKVTIDGKDHDFYPFRASDSFGAQIAWEANPLQALEIPVLLMENPSIGKQPDAVMDLSIMLLTHGGFDMIADDGELIDFNAPYVSTYRDSYEDEYTDDAFNAFFNNEGITTELKAKVASWTDLAFIRRADESWQITNLIRDRADQFGELYPETTIDTAKDDLKQETIQFLVNYMAPRVGSDDPQTILGQWLNDLVNAAEYHQIDESDFFSFKELAADIVEMYPELRMPTFQAMKERRAELNKEREGIRFSVKTEDENRDSDLYLMIYRLEGIEGEIHKKRPKHSARAEPTAQELEAD